MATVLAKKEKSGTKKGRSPYSACTILKMDVTMSPVTRFFSTVTGKGDSSSENQCVTVIDKGGSVEFILPKGTAQFAEMSVLDSRGKLVWKTQALNEDIIVWPKQNTGGEKVPGGRYLFHMKQGNLHADGVAMIA